MDERWSKAMAATSLKEAHEAVEGLMPAPNASRELWLDFHRRAVGVYERIADVDRWHHHEALYWVSRERAKAEQVARAGSSGGSDRAGRVG
ncbi:AMED_5909 family protein [Actinosynnema sp. NPDC050436]|uniref:AMED_5909 family protein n=1 Tax=Actinosynnema sp. NPDC050436 TaxID=3155659 RepID=UPI0033EDD984